MKEKYKEFAKKFNELCGEFVSEDFDVDEVTKICSDIAKLYGE